MYFVYEKNGSLGYRGKNAGKVFRLIKGRSARNLEVDPKLVCGNLGKGCLAKTRRTDKEHVIKAFRPFAGSLDEYAQIGLYMLLALKIRKELWPERPVALVVNKRFGPYYALFGIHVIHAL